MYELEQQLYIYSAILFLVVLYVVSNYLHVRTTEPMKVFIIPWIIMLTLIASGLVWYDKIFNITTFFATILSVLAFYSGALLKRCTYKASLNTRSKIEIKTFSNFNLAVIILGTILYFIFVLIDLKAIFTGIGLSDISLQLFYKKHWAQYHDAEKDVFVVIKNISEVCALLVGMSLSVFHKNKNNKIFIFISLIAWFSIISSAMLEGTRFMIAVLFVSSAYIYVLVNNTNSNIVDGSAQVKSSSNKGMKKIYFRASVIFVIISLFIIYPAVRKPELAENVNQSLNRHHNSELGGWVSDVSNIKGLGWLPVFAFGTSYLSHPIVKYTFFTNVSDIEDWYMWGAYNFPIYSRVKSIFKDDVSGRKDARQKIAEISKEYGYTTNPWATGIRDLVIDFGYIGTIIFLFLFGYFSQYVYQKSLLKRESEWLLINTITIVSCAIFAFLSPFGLGIIINSLLFSVLLISTKRFKIS